MISHGYPGARKGVIMVDLVVGMIWRGQGDIEMGTMIDVEERSMGWCSTFRLTMCDVENEVEKEIGDDDRDHRDIPVIQNVTEEGSLRSA